MTTIAWDGRSLAADRKISWGGGAMGETRKVHRRDSDGALIGVCGGTGVAQALADWFLTGEVGVKPDLSPTDDDAASGLIIRPDGALWHIYKHGLVPVSAPFLAFGSGADYALGAMAQGATAREAVAVAIRFDNGSGGEIDVLHAQGMGKSAQPRQFITGAHWRTP